MAWIPRKGPGRSLIRAYIISKIEGGTLMKKVLLAGLLGAIAMFVWTFLAHQILPLGEAGVKEIPNEAPVLSAMRSSIGNASGFYLFPGMGLGPNATSQQK